MNDFFPCTRKSLIFEPTMNVERHPIARWVSLVKHVKPSPRTLVFLQLRLRFSWCMYPLSFPSHLFNKLVSRRPGTRSGRIEYLHSQQPHLWEKRQESERWEASEEPKDQVQASSSYPLRAPSVLPRRIVAPYLGKGVYIYIMLRAGCTSGLMRKCS